MAKRFGTIPIEDLTDYIEQHNLEEKYGGAYRFDYKNFEKTFADIIKNMQN
eukprot:CAMPEP_0117421540 /NCGR_PEP_ID=MMETSP0758-20121206/2597_1 /TAXON_ID=63605 /ORGANISM="Percolomonas cosmopolitus, Strain AE-1 (ATCC 50343)" /LENGTH=50 /DNA_ID=CAMNT_0005203697 /DNA_START=618 /DNA_END=770 /DNA_ORIENTATION=-